MRQNVKYPLFVALSLILPLTMAYSEYVTVAPVVSSEGILQDKVLLGKRLFFDVRLSKNNSISCHSCHDFSKGGADGRQFAVGINGVRGEINTPTILNSALNFKQFWNGRAEDLVEQVDGPIHNPAEMGSSWPEVVSKLNADEVISASFTKIYDEPIGRNNIIDAITEFEKSLVTLNSPFDRHLRGVKNALTEQQILGYQKFNSYGCIACHQGQNMGGNMFQTMGVARDYFKDRGGHFSSDLGRFVITKKTWDLHVFKVPSLRNVALTAPYFHDGSEASLSGAVRKMAKYQLGRSLPEEDVRDITAFLTSLTGEMPIAARGP